MSSSALLFVTLQSFFIDDLRSFLFFPLKGHYFGINEKGASTIIGRFKMDCLAQSVGCGSGHNLRVLGLSPELGICTHGGSV